MDNDALEVLSEMNETMTDVVLAVALAGDISRKSDYVVELNIQFDYYMIDVTVVPKFQADGYDIRFSDSPDFVLDKLRELDKLIFRPEEDSTGQE